MAPSDQWRWTDEEGVQRLLDADELRAALADGRLKPTTLVWRRGMKRWLPAGSVPELAGESGGSGPSGGTGVSLGDVAQPTPSIPAVQPGASSSRPMPENLVDIAALRNKSRGRKETMPGPGGVPGQPQSATAPRVSDDMDGATTVQRESATAPKKGDAAVGDGGADRKESKEGRASGRGRRRKITKLGGPWSTADADDETKTYVRDDLEEQKRERDAAKKAAEPEAGSKAQIRISAKSTPEQGSSAGTPFALSPSLSPPAPTGAKDRPDPGAAARPSRPPPPRGKRPSTQVGPGSPKAKQPDKGGASQPAGRGRKRSIPPPAPRHRAGKSVPPKKGSPIAKAMEDKAAKPADRSKSPAPGKVSAAGASQAKPAVAAGAAGAAEPTAAAEPGKSSPKVQPTAPLPATAPVSAGSKDALASAAQSAPATGEPAPFDQPLVARQPAAGLQPSMSLADEAGGDDAIPTRVDDADEGPGAPAQPALAAPTTPAAPAAQPAMAPPPEPSQPALAPPAEPSQPALPPPAEPSQPALAPPAEPSQPAHAPPPWEAGAGALPGVVEPANRDSWPRPPKAAGRAAMTVKLSMVIGAAVVVGLLLASSFVAGRLTAPAQSGLADVVRARTGVIAVPLYARSRLPDGASAGSLRPCLMKRAPARWAPAASKSIPFEIAATPAGKLAIGYAMNAKRMSGMIVDPGTGAIEERREPPKEPYDLSRVVPVVDAEQNVLFASTREEEAGVHNAVWVSAPKPFIVGFKKGECVALDDPDGEARTLWPVEGDDYPNALRTLVVPQKGVAVAYRHDNKSWYGWLAADGSVGHPAKVFESTAVESGKPMIAHNGRDVSLVYAERPEKKQPAVIRWARAPIGEPLGEAKPVELPPGGPGADAIAPAIAGLSRGRWLLMWTEGERGRQRVLRAQTYDSAGAPIGEALRVSPATGSFGQGTVGVRGESAAVVFLLAARRGYRRVYEIWGTVLQCQ